MKKIIIIDDDLAIQDAVSRIFSPKDFKVTIFQDGDPILKGGYELPDIFVIDKLLPGVDGIDLCKILKHEKTTRNLPVIIMSASPQMSRNAMMAGAVGFLEKPFSVHEMRKMVMQWIKD
jgi:FixJ family two-component response regulator